MSLGCLNLRCLWDIQVEMSSQSEVWVGDIYLEAKMTAEFLRPCINEDTKEQSQSGFLVISRL